MRCRDAIAHDRQRRICCLATWLLGFIGRFVNVIPSLLAEAATAASAREEFPSLALTSSLAPSGRASPSPRSSPLEMAEEQLAASDDSCYERERRVLRALERLDDKNAGSSSEASSPFSTTSSSSEDSNSFSLSSRPRTSVLARREFSSDQSRLRRISTTSPTASAVDGAERRIRAAVDSVESRRQRTVAASDDAEHLDDASAPTIVLASGAGTGATSTEASSSLRALSGPAPHVTAAAETKSVGSTMLDDRHVMAPPTFAAAPLSPLCPGIEQSGARSSRIASGGSVDGRTSAYTRTSLHRIRLFLSPPRDGDLESDGLVPVPLDYLTDPFNLAQLPPVVEEIGQFYLGQNEEIRNHPGGDYVRKSEHLTSFPMYRSALDLITAAVSMGPLVSPDEEEFGVDEDEGLAVGKGKDCDFDEASFCLAVERAAVALYLLVHQRYVASPRGLEHVRRRFLRAEFEGGGNDPVRAAYREPSTASLHTPRLSLLRPVFGRCPNRACQGYPLLPYGESDAYTLLPANHPEETLLTTPRRRQVPSDKAPASPEALSQERELEAGPRFFSHRAQRYCASCRQIYCHWPSRVDGCAWGPSFCHLFLLALKDSVSDAPFWPESGFHYESSISSGENALESANYGERAGCGHRGTDVEPRVFGFRVHPRHYEIAVDMWCRVD